MNAVHFEVKASEGLKMPLCSFFAEQLVPTYFGLSEIEYKQLPRDPIKFIHILREHLPRNDEVSIDEILAVHPLLMWLRPNFKVGWTFYLREAEFCKELQCFVRNDHHRSYLKRRNYRFDHGQFLSVTQIFEHVPETEWDTLVTIEKSEERISAAARIRTEQRSKHAKEVEKKQIEEQRARE